MHTFTSKYLYYSDKLLIISLTVLLAATRVYSEESVILSNRGEKSTFRLHESSETYLSLSRQLLPVKVKPLKTVAVLPFNTSNPEIKSHTALITERLTNTLIRSGKCIVVERAYLNQILSESKLGLTGAVSEQSAAKIGNLVGAQMVVIGSVEEGSSELNIFARLVNVESGKVIRAGDGTIKIERIEVSPLIPAPPPVSTRPGQSIPAPSMSSMTFKLTRNGKEYVCKDTSGREGYNKITVEELVRSKNGECSDFTNGELNNIELVGAVLRGANLSRASLINCQIYDSDLTGANLQEAELVQTVLIGVILRDVNMRKVRMVKSGIGNAMNPRPSDMSGSDLSEAFFEGSGIQDVDLRDAKMIKLNFVNSMTRVNPFLS